MERTVKKMTYETARTKRYAYFWSWLVPNIAVPVALVEQTYGIFKGTATTTTTLTFGGIAVGLFALLFTMKALKDAGKASNDAILKIATSSTGLPITMWIMTGIMFALRSNLDNLIMIFGGMAATQTATLALLIKHTKYRDAVEDYKENHKSEFII
jgi:uncharacterized membrane protein YhaH (DUF805 family)